MSSAFINDLKLVFRAEGDSEEERKMSTPNEATILRNVELLQQRWKDIKYDSDEAVLNPDVCNEIEKLKKHINKGCLSRIPPGGGSNRNENLHKNLRAVIARSKLGCELAEALLATFFYIWNERRSSCGLPPGCVRPVQSYRAELLQRGFVPTNEKFGIVILPTENESMKLSQTHDCEAMQTTMTNVECDSSIQQRSSHENLTDKELQNILSQAVNMSMLFIQLKSLCNNPKFNARLMYLMPCSLLLLSNAVFQSSSVTESEERLRNNLLCYGLEVSKKASPVSPENSFFHCISSQLNELCISSVPLKEHLHSLAKVNWSIYFDTQSVNQCHNSVQFRCCH